MDSQEIINIFLLVAFAISYFLFKDHLQKYLEQKGKNLADKEDIQSITNLVEEVKKRFTKENEFLKANLAVLSNTQLNLVNEERNSILDFVKCYFEWFGLNMYIPTLPYSNVEIEKYERSIHSKYSELLSFEAVFDLFANDNNLKSLKKDLKVKTLKPLSSMVIKYFADIKFNNLKLNYVEKNKPSDDKGKRYKSILDERIKINEKFKKETVVIYDKIMGVQNEFQSKCREYLYKLLAKQ